MSLFNRLLSLNANNIPLEDFFTEIVAYLFTEHKYLLLEWLKKLHLLDEKKYIDAEISTQQQFDPLSHHSIASRPDILIRLQTEENHHDLIVIESKIGSHEGENQLSRYADILHSLNGYRRKILIYITRDFEPKTKDEVFKNMPPSNVQFIQLRWHQFYRFLCSQQNSPFIQEIILFMKEKNMAHNNQFSSIDILTLSNLLNSLQMMEQIISGKVRDEFKKVIGNPKQENSMLSRLKNSGEYFLIGNMSDGLGCLIGFVLRNATVTDYPKVSCHLQVSPTSTCREKVILAMQSICKENENWYGYKLQEKGWSGIVREKSLQNFLAEEDHIVAIETFFLEVLDEVKQIKQQYPELPWRSE